MPKKRRERKRGRRPEREIARSEFATLRLDPRLRYLVELGARKQRRTVSSYLEWAAEQSLDWVLLSDRTHRSIADEAAQLWDVDKVERFVKLAARYPDLLNHEEQTLWKLIGESQYVWPRRNDEQPLENLSITKLRMFWDQFISVAKGQASRTVLPE